MVVLWWCRCAPFRRFAIRTSSANTKPPDPNGALSAPRADSRYRGAVWRRPLPSVISVRTCAFPKCGRHHTTLLRARETKCSSRRRHSFFWSLDDERAYRGWTGPDRPLAGRPAAAAPCPVRWRTCLPRRHPIRLCRRPRGRVMLLLLLLLLLLQIRRGGTEKKKKEEENDDVVARDAYCHSPPLKKPTPTPTEGTRSTDEPLGRRIAWLRLRRSLARSSSPIPPRWRAGSLSSIAAKKELPPPFRVVARENGTRAAAGAHWPPGRGRGRDCRAPFILRLFSPVALARAFLSRSVGFWRWRWRWSV
jgi:hypothetical protein